MQAKKDCRSSTANNEKPCRQLDIFKSSFFVFSLTNCAVKNPNYMGSPYVGVLVGCSSRAPNQQPALSSHCAREPSSVCKTTQAHVTASGTVPLPLSPLAQNNPVHPLNSREKRNCFKPMIFGVVYDAVMGRTHSKGANLRKKTWDLGKKGTKRMAQRKLNSRYREQLITLDRVYGSIHCQRKLCKSVDLVPLISNI